MREFVTTLLEMEAVRNYIEQEFEKYCECCGVFMPPFGASIKVVEPLQSCFINSPDWGTRNLVGGCLPVGLYKMDETAQNNNFQNFKPVDDNGCLLIDQQVITVSVGYPRCSLMDWRGARKFQLPVSTEATTGGPC